MTKKADHYATLKAPCSQQIQSLQLPKEISVSWNSTLEQSCFLFVCLFVCFGGSKVLQAEKYFSRHSAPLSPPWKMFSRKTMVITLQLETNIWPTLECGWCASEWSSSPPVCCVVNFLMSPQAHACSSCLLAPSLEPL